MAGTLADSKLSAPNRTGIRFALAAEADDRAIRQLLRDNPMRGEISLSFEREPNYFLGTGVAGSTDQTMLAFQGEQLLCMGRCSIRRRYIKGVAHRVGYLAELRLDARAQGRFDILRDGYQFLRELHRDSPPDAYFTSIAADNHRAIRLFGRGLAGLPTYRFLTEFVTMVIPVSRQAAKQAEQKLRSSGLRLETGSENNLSALTAFLNAQASQHALASHWTAEDIRSLSVHGLRLADFQLVLKGNKIVVCTALWDQRSFRQTVIRGYGAKTVLIRPLVNSVGRLFNLPYLPELGAEVAQGFLSPLAWDTGYEWLLPDVVALCSAAAKTRSIELLALGCAANALRLPLLQRHFYCRPYRSRLYRVVWPDSPASINDFDATDCLPEVALL